MAAIWVKSLPIVRNQISVLELMAEAVQSGTLTDELRRSAEREAHRLAGSAGSFGFHSASVAARELEEMLESDAPLPAPRVVELVGSLRRTLDTDTLP